MSTASHVSVLGEKSVGPTAKDSLLLSAMWGDISNTESRFELSNMVSSLVYLWLESRANDVEGKC